MTRVARQVLAGAEDVLRGAGVPSPNVDARLLLRHVVGATAPWQEIDDNLQTKLQSLTARRSDRVPLQLLTGEVAFRSLLLDCRPGVFVPRPETEVLAQLAIDAIDAANRAVVVDLCTGLGPVALSVAVEAGESQVWAVDCDPKAVAATEKNLQKIRSGRADVAGLAAGSTVEVRLGDLFDALPDDLCGRVDVVASNPPYLTSQEVKDSDPEVRDHDPLVALVGGPSGNEVTIRLLDEARSWLSPDGRIFVEVSELRAETISSVAREMGYRDVRVHRDLTDRPRVLAARAAT